MVGCANWHVSATEVGGSSVNVCRHRRAVPDSVEAGKKTPGAEHRSAPSPMIRCTRTERDTARMSFFTMTECLHSRLGFRLWKLIAQRALPLIAKAHGAGRRGRDTGGKFF